MSEQQRRRDAFATRAVHAGLTPDPTFGSVIPAIHQTSTYAQRSPGEFLDDYDVILEPTLTSTEKDEGFLSYGLMFCSVLTLQPLGAPFGYDTYHHEFELDLRVEFELHVELVCQPDPTLELGHHLVGELPWSGDVHQRRGRTGVCHLHLERAGDWYRCHHGYQY